MSSSRPRTATRRTCPCTKPSRRTSWSRTAWTAVRSPALTAPPFGRSCRISISGRAPSGWWASSSRRSTSLATGRRAVITTMPTLGKKSAMDDVDARLATAGARGGARALQVLRPNSRFARACGRVKWRPLLRALHRDTGYVAVGLTFVYATSGLAVNHVADWDPNFHNTSETHEIGGPLPEDDAAAGAKVTEALGIREAPKEVYREGDELQKPRFFVRAANWLHLNRGKKGWTYFADSYAVGLLFLATSGLFMLSGKKGFFGRGAVLVAIGVAAPLAYMLAVRG